MAWASRDAVQMRLGAAWGKNLGMVETSCGRGDASWRAVGVVEVIVSMASVSLGCPSASA
jgi:hypothetical protein